MHDEEDSDVIGPTSPGSGHRGRGKAAAAASADPPSSNGTPIALYNDFGFY